MRGFVARNSGGSMDERGMLDHTHNAGSFSRCRIASNGHSATGGIGVDLDARLAIDRSQKYGAFSEPIPKTVHWELLRT